MNRATRMPSASALLSLKLPATARGEADANAAQIAPGFANLAGSRENAIALVHALHDGVSVSLTLCADPASPAEIVAIESPTGAMIWKDVKMALMLARDALLRYGIIHPSGRQLHAALVGGQAAAPNGRLVSFRGVLRMRAEGLNWGRIAAERFLRPELATRRLSSLSPEVLRA